jgi:hydroxymethylpyrimidine/phosphomethylpyrimidine kinase
MTEPTHHSPPSGRVLIIAGSDSGGGAGIQGDIKTVSALGGYAMTAITALTAQNTLGVFGIHPIPEAFIAQQIDLCLSDIGADAIKTGMLHSAGVIEAVVSCLDAHSGGKPSPLGGEGLDEGAGSLADIRHAPPSNLPPQGGEAFPAAPLVPLPLIVDPVMVAKGGAPLLEAAALHALKTLLIPAATIITPNLPEAELLLGRSIASGDADATDMKRAAEELLGLGCEAVLLKGGHGTGEMLTDILVTRHQAPGTKHLLTLTAPRIATLSTHGTGCAFASAIATGLAQKLSLAEAVTRAHGYVQQAIARAPGFGAGNGPLGH